MEWNEEWNVEWQSGRGRKKKQVPRSRVKVRTVPPDTIVSSPHALVAPPVIQPPTAHLSSPVTMYM